MWDKSGADASSAILVFERPYAAALATALLLVTSPLVFQLPTVVRQLLFIVARVLRDPAPRALFMGYGDSAINFELRVWPSHFNQATQVRSDLAAAVYDAVNAAGMSIPLPQREVRLLRDPVPDSNADIVKPAAKSSARPDEEDKSA